MILTHDFNIYVLNSPCYPGVTGFMSCWNHPFNALYMTHTGDTERCMQTTFGCSDYLRTTIPKAFVCDGERDCDNGRDEINCC